VNTIFVQIAAYRDPELVPTVLDCIDKAKYPKNLKFCIGWQHAPDEDISPIKKLKNVKILDIPYTESKGACWIRHKIQKEYNKETYTLQLDSHHRFVKDWDVELIKMFKSLKSRKTPKPLISSYLPSYQPTNDPAARLNECWQLNYDRFMPEGPIFLRPSFQKGWQEMKSCPYSRGLSAHFIFTLGKWCKEVKYDPNLYFHGEEISLAVRSYTHGYDLFHPYKVLVWHQYTREGQKKHWDDSKDWGALNASSYKRVKILLGVDGEDPNQIDFKEFGLGKKRTLAQFERYAGVDFKRRKFHKDVLSEKLPPVDYVNEEKFQSELVSRFKHCIDVYRGDIPENDYDFWCVVFKDKDNKDMYRRDADENEIKGLVASNPNDKFVHLWREFDTAEKPYKWTVWPHSKSKGWDTKIIENVINYN
jgi:hypothetical protein